MPGYQEGSAVPSEIYVDMDVLSKGNASLILNEKGQGIGKPFSLRSNLPSAAQFTDILVEIAKEKNSEKVYVGCEAASVYSWHL